MRTVCNESGLIADETLQGQIDCQKGKDCPEDASESYKRGWGTEYEREQVLDVLSGWGFA